MAKTPKKTPDRHYDFRSMNVWFAWSSLALLAVTLWMVFADYAKPWKRLQSEFRELEAQKIAAEAEAERAGLDAAEIEALEASIAGEQQALDTQQAEIDALEDEKTTFDKRAYEADADSRATKSLLDTARYELDVAMQHGGEAGIAKAQGVVDDLVETLRQQRISLETFLGESERVAEALEGKRSGLKQAEDRLGALRTGVTNLETRLAGLDKDLPYFLLNAPVLDLFEPGIKIEQVILPSLYQNINFAEVQRVDRCMTCHVAADRSGFDTEEWAHPFRTHPRLDLYVSANSPHPYTEFGCTTCHQGLDRATDFARVGHTPRTDEQLAAWKKEWNWKPQKFLETPILPAGTTEAGCISCHAAEIWTPGSETQEVGRELVTKMGCYGCHVIDYPGYEDLPKSGPDLRKIASKTNPGWAYKWIEAPRDFHPTTWMPHFFYQENITGDLNMERQKAEIASTVAYLWDQSESPTYSRRPAGNATRGQELFENVGCTGCHLKDADANRDDYFPQFNRLHGPNLIRTGSKVDEDWLYAWVQDPKNHNPDSRMPSLRLTDQEAADITSYLMDSRDTAFEGLEVPSVNAEVRDGLVLQYLQNNFTLEGSEAELATMDDHARDVYLGGQTIQKYGCYGCHVIAGFEDAQPIGVELTEEGSKPLHQFDFGHVHDVPHTRHDWIKTKLLRPRIWDHGKELVKSYDELYRMPNFGMSDREASAVMTNVLGFIKEGVREEYKAGQEPDAAAIAEGRKLITWYNCQGCHLIEGEGQAIKTALEDVDLLPPNLAAQGARAQSDWLFEYLHDPGSETMRPWLTARMPSFEFSDDQVNSIIAYFASTDGREPFLSEPTPASARARAVGDVAFNLFQCAKCHPSGPQPAGGAVSAGELAPSLLLAKDRLRHDWVADWILDPQSWVPGTRMPTNFAQGSDGVYQSPIANAIDAPMFASQKRQLMRHFDTEEDLKAYLGDAELVTEALRDHIWWSLN